MTTPTVTPKQTRLCSILVSGSIDTISGDEMRSISTVPQRNHYNVICLLFTAVSQNASVDTHFALTCTYLESLYQTKCG